MASQASVPHHDTATVIALLSLWTGLGGSIGNAIASAIWTSKMPENLTARLSGRLSAEEISTIFGSITVARTTEPEIRELVLLGAFRFSLFSSEICSLTIFAAYNDTVKNNLYLPALIFSIVPLVAAALTVRLALPDRSQL